MSVEIIITVREPDKADHQIAHRFDSLEDAVKALGGKVWAQEGKAAAAALEARSSSS
jgi:hypothetical protein